MTLKIHTEEDDQRQLKMTVEVEEARVDQAMRQAARKLARDMHIPGFRPGKAPYRVVLRRVGKDALRAEVAEEMIQPILEEAVEQVAAELSAPPSLDDIAMEPLMYSFTVPLSPLVELGSYREMRREIAPVEIKEEAIEEALEQIRVRHQILEDVDRPAQAGDVVTISGRGDYAPIGGAETSDGETETPEEEPQPDGAPGEAEEQEVENAVTDGATDEGESESLETGDLAADDGSDEEDDEQAPPQGIIFDEESLDLLLDEEKLFSGTPFVQNVIGLSAGDVAAFSFVFPDDFVQESLAGKEGSFDFTILNVKSRELPDLDDELAKLAGSYESLEEMREATEKRLREQATSQARNELIEKMLDDLLPETKMVYPPAVVEQEIDNMLDSFKRQVSGSGWEWSDYLKLQGDSEDSVREEFRERAEEQLRRRFTLRQFVLEEKLVVEESDVETEIEKRVEDMGDNEEFKASMAHFYRSGSGLDMISSDILMDKVYLRAKAILSGSATELSEESVDDSGESEEEE